MPNRRFRTWMVTKQGDLYADRPTKDVELLECAGGRGDGFCCNVWDWAAGHLREGPVHLSSGDLK
jgi:hypothetical protein